MTLSSDRGLLVLTARAPDRPGALGGGPSTPALAAAVSEAGGLGFLAAGYRTPDAVRADLGELRRSRAPVRAEPVRARAAERRRGGARALRGGAARRGRALGVELGEPRYDDDHWEAKLELAREERVPVVSFTFGCPDAAVVRSLQDAGWRSWVTVTTPAEARRGGRGRRRAGGAGHRGRRAPRLLRPGAPGRHRPAGAAAARPRGDRPAARRHRRHRDRPGVAAVLAAGAAAAQLGTAFMLTPEAATSPAHREALARRRAHGAYARVHRPHGARHREPLHARARGRGAARLPGGPQPRRAAAGRGARAGDAEGFNLWAGQAYPLAAEAAGRRARRALADEAREALDALGSLGAF